jgi:hypothetical protein
MPVAVDKNTTRRCPGKKTTATSTESRRESSGRPASWAAALLKTTSTTTGLEKIDKCLVVQVGGL